MASKDSPGWFVIRTSALAALRIAVDQQYIGEKAGLDLPDLVSSEGLTAIRRG